MKYGFCLLIIECLVISCKNQTLQNIADHGQMLADSSAIYDDLSKRYVAAIQMNQTSKSAYANFVSTTVQAHNELIDSIIQVMSERAVNLNDRTVSTKYLVEQENAVYIRQAINELVLELEAASELDLPQRAKILFWEINDGLQEENDNWASSKFKNMPFALSKTTLQQWQFNNSKACALILLDLRQKRTEKNTLYQ
ncbi:MAG: hypothetical protein AAGI49_14010 [Bacteroidota bacterium]